MITNELLEEIWRIKEDLAREADYDINKFFDQLRDFTANNPLPPPVLRTHEQVLRYLDFGELPAPTAETAAEAAEAAPASAVREDDPDYDARAKS